MCNRAWYLWTFAFGEVVYEVLYSNPVGSLLSWPGCDFRDSNHSASGAHRDSSFRHCRSQSHRREIASAKLRAVGSGTRQEGRTF